MGYTGPLSGFTLSAGQSLDPATSAWVSAVITDGGTVSAIQQGYVDTLIRGLKTDGLWAGLYRLWLYGSENIHQANIDVVNLAHLASVNSMTFTANHGYSGVNSGGGTFIDTGVVPASASSPTFTQDNMSMSVYNITSRTTTEAVAGAHLAVNDGSNLTCMIRLIVDSLRDRHAINQTAQAIPVDPSPQAAGFWSASRVVSTDVLLYKNGSQLFDTVISSAGLPTTFSLYSNAWNQSGTVADSTADTLSAVHIGAGLSATGALQLSNRVNAYMTSLGINVY